MEAIAFEIFMILITKWLDAWPLKPTDKTVQTNRALNKEFIVDADF